MRYFIIILMLVNIAACSIFDTRNPEEPNGDNGIFIPPTTPNIVINNLINAFNNKNINNYLSCLSSKEFHFTPTTDVMVRYQSVFDSWNINKENQYFSAAITAMNKSSNPVLIINNQKENSDFNFDFISQDSATFISEYTITCEFPSMSIPQNFMGKIIFTIKPENTGLWAISDWQDFKLTNDTNNSTWSNFKAYFGN